MKIALLLLVALAVPATAQSNGRGQLVVDTDWLAQHLDDPDLVLLHVGDEDDYAREHIPGAHYIRMRDVSIGFRRDAELVLELMTPSELRDALARFGIADDSRIVVYYGEDWVPPTTRIVFTMHYAGLGDRTSVLDGGMPAWKAAGHAVTDRPPSVRAGALSELETVDLVVDADWVRRHIEEPGYALVDGRAAMFYDGVRESRGKRGHIAAAGSFPFTEAFDEELRLKTPEQLRALLRSAGVEPGDTVVGYCHIGQQATVVLFVARTLGYAVRLYDGSMQDWARRDLDVEVPPEGGR